MVGTRIVYKRRTRGSFFESAILNDEWAKPVIDYSVYNISIEQQLRAGHVHRRCCTWP